MQDTSGNVFNRIRVEKPGYSNFNLSYDYKLSMRMGKLVPVHLQECVPGDKFTMSSEAMFRMMPMIAPIMHKVDIFFHNFFVPNRILWPNWEKYVTGGEAYIPGASSPAFPVFDNLSGSLGGGQIPPSSVWNYLGLPTDITVGSPISAIPCAGYQRIFYEFYRDQNLDVFDPVMLTDGDQPAPNFAYYNELRDRAWEHDYFTSCLPFAQKGAPVEMPVNISGLDILADSGPEPKWRRRSTGTPFGQAWIASTDPAGIGVTAGDSGMYDSGLGVVTWGEGYYDPQGSLYIDEDNVSLGATINDLRSAFSLQKWLEKNARAGSRYIESILAHFGVQSSDKRLQRPEYLGGSTATLQISEVLQTSATDPAATAQGNMSGHGVSITGGFQHSYRCEEHGYIFTILSIRPKTAYYQGIPRHFRKFIREDFYWPDFAFLGEQEVLNGEVCWSDDPLNDDLVFGYIPRYSEYRYNPSRVAGQMATSLDYWHMGRLFDPLFPPQLNKDFITCNPTDRIFAVDDPNNDVIVAHVFHNINAVRPMPKYGTPGSI